MMRRVFSTIFLSFTAVIAFAQTSDESSISTDRPTQSASAYTVPKGAFQIETGYQLQNTNFYEGFTNPVEFQSRNILYNTSLVRFGLGGKVEIRMIQEIQNTILKQRGVKGSNLGESGLAATPTLIGAKVQLFESQGNGTQIAFLGHLGGPLLSEVQSGTQMDMAFAVQHSLSPKWSLGYNLGGVWTNGISSSAFKYTVVTGYQISDKLNSFLEFYGFKSPGQDLDIQTDFGLTYLINNRTQVDGYVGFGLQENSRAMGGPPDFLLGFGISFLLPKK